MYLDEFNFRSDYFSLISLFLGKSAKICIREICHSSISENKSTQNFCQLFLILNRFYLFSDTFEWDLEVDGCQANFFYVKGTVMQAEKALINDR